MLSTEIHPRARRVCICPHPSLPPQELRPHPHPSPRERGEPTLLRRVRNESIIFSCCNVEIAAGKKCKKLNEQCGEHLDTSLDGDMS